MANPVEMLNSVVRSVYTATERLDGLQREVTEMRGSVALLRSDMGLIAKDVAVLTARMEEQRKTFEAQMRAVVAETVAEFRVRYAEEQANRRSNPSLPVGEE